MKQTFKCCFVSPQCAIIFFLFFLQSGFLERYPQRPTGLEEICLAEFVARYRYLSKKSPNHGSDSDEMQEFEHAKDALPNPITLKGGYGHMTLRTQPAIIRSHQWSKIKDPEKFYHAQLLLYFPWRNETEDLMKETYQEMFTEKSKIVQENRSKFEKHAEDVEQAVEMLDECGPPEESWNILAPQTEQNRIEELQEGMEDVQTVPNAFDTTREHFASTELGIHEYRYEFGQEQMSGADWQGMILSLNSRQYEVHQYIVDWCTSLLLSHKSPRPDPFYLFLTGGAGVGKSHLVRTIVQTVSRMLSRNNQAQEKHILVTAPTGAAAYNISGHTLHSAFLLPCTRSDDYIPLSSEKLAALKEEIGNTKVLIIDEISMVGADMLLTIHRRLCDIMGNDDPFGRVSILAVGDLLQLPPVAQKAVYSLPSDGLAAMYGSLWQNLFQIVELTEVQRQKNDHEFASMLNRVRIGTHIQEDIDALNARQVALTENYHPMDVTHIFPYNRQVHDHNTKMLQQLATQQVTVHAIDSKRDDQTGQIDTTSFQTPVGGLLKTLTVAVDARVMLIKNIDVQDGLVNSATGVVTGFYPLPPQEQDMTYIPKYILVKFDDDRVGQNCRKEDSHRFNDGSTPIPMIESKICLGRYSKVTRKRTQFPLALAWAVTIHKEQGKTENMLALSCEGNFQAGQFYTAVSRTKTLKGLYLLNEVSQSKIKTNKAAVKELARMRKDNEFHFHMPISLLDSPQTHFKLSIQNMNSIHAHQDCMLKDNFIENSHVACFQETWLKPNDVTPQVFTHNSLRHDGCTNEQNRRGGLLMYVHHDFRVQQSYCGKTATFEHQMAILSPREYPTVRICIISVYRNPRSDTYAFLQQMEMVLHKIPFGLCALVCGDFNINLQYKEATSEKAVEKKGQTSEKVLQLFRHHGLHQLVRKSTHRSGSLLDHVYSNIKMDHLDVIPTYYSDHFLISMSVPLKTLNCDLYWSHHYEI